MILDREGVVNLLDTYDKETKAIKDELFRICWYMRGASFTEAHMLTFEDRQIIASIIEKNLEITKESGTIETRW